VDYVHLREKSDKMKEVNVQMVKDICQALQKYQESASTEHMAYYYDCLSPSTVVFDQRMLRPMLKFEPLLTAALGLGNRPATIENILTLFPTPQGFDYFQSLEELKPENQLILNDPYYGCVELYKGHDRTTNNYDIRLLNEEYKQRQLLRQEMTVWRFLLTSYYLHHGTPYGRETGLLC
jgi:hypothetical protein